MSQMPLIPVWKKYDLSLAITAMRMLAIESHSMEDLKRILWDPTQKLLQNLEKQEPQYLLCLMGKPRLSFGKEGFSSHVSIVGPNQKVAYLGTVVDRQKANEIWEWFLKEIPGSAEKFKAHGPMTIIRWWIMCSIPVNSCGINQQTAEQGVKKYMKLFAPSLSELPIIWLPKKEQAAINSFILKESLCQAKPQTKEERTHIFSADIF